MQIYEQALKCEPSADALRSRLKAWRDEAAKDRLVDGPFTIAFDGPAEGRLATHATAVLEAAYWRVGKGLGAYPSQPVEVISTRCSSFAM